MPETKDFAHLQLPLRYIGKPKLHGGGSQFSRTKQNRKNRIEHGNYLKHRATELSRFWKSRQSENTLTQIQKGIPILLEIDPSTDIDFLFGMGFEIISEIENGFIIVASDDVNLTTLNDKLDAFIDNVNKRCNSPAKIYALCEEEDRLKRILSKELYQKWTTILPDKQYIIDIGVSCNGNIKLLSRPSKQNDESEEAYKKREQNWQEKCRNCYMRWDSIKMDRETILENFISEYNGQIIETVDGEQGLTDAPDSFSARLKISGKCLRDLVLNFPYIFEAFEPEEVSMEHSTEKYEACTESVQIRPPLPSDPIVCILDSGIQEGHRYLSPAILKDESVNFLSKTKIANDEVNNGGHGTRVAGAVLYPKSIPRNGTYQLPCWIRNMRILDKNNALPLNIYPPATVKYAVKTYNIESPNPTKIFNHSIGTTTPYELTHMSAWASEIDSQSYDHDVLFIQAAGNIDSNIISAYWQAGFPYPKYLDKDLCRIADPAQSLQALTVGSVSATDFENEDFIALGKKDEVSSFSRSGPGIWDGLKPEVVEYGGTHLYNKGSNPPQLTTPREVCPELIRKSPEGPAFSRDDIGTSFSAPNVSYIASQIQKILPDSPALLYRALIAQSARWPRNINEISKTDCIDILRHIGYGIPDVDRATHNSAYRVTLITPSLIEIGDNEAHIFQIPIPDELSNVGEDYDILVEITLSYASKPRRTRRNIKGYLSTWLDWRCSRIGERAETFAQRILETDSSIEDDGNFKWVIGEASNRGMAHGFSRKNSTLQKDWCIIKSNQLSDAFCIAVRGHKGWCGLFKAKYALAVSFEAIHHDVRIYEPIRSEIELSIEDNEIGIEIADNDE